MATQTIHLGSFENGACEFQVDYDDVGLYLKALRCINNTNYQAWGQATLTSNPAKTGSRTFAANQTTTLNLPTGVSTRLGISIVTRGTVTRLDGVDYSLMCPYP